MRIRTLTVGIAIESVEELCSTIDTALTYLKDTENHLQGKGYEIQTLRICTNSFEEWLLPMSVSNSELYNQDMIQNIQESLDLIKSHCLKVGLGFLSLGPATSLKGADIIPCILENLPMASVSLNIPPISDTNHSLFVEKAVDLCYNKLGRVNSLYNFRFCASFNCPPGIPFFPASYFTSNQGNKNIAIKMTSSSSDLLTVDDQRNKKYALMVGLECSDLLVESFVNQCTTADSLARKEEIFRQHANDSIVPLERAIQSYIQEMEKSSSQYLLQYAGIDTSMNPSLDEDFSIVRAYESVLGEGKFGSVGTLAISSVITKVMKEIPIDKKTGYCGLMLPVMEDKLLARRAMEGTYSIQDLVMWSSVCGVGCDTVPVSFNSWDLREVDDTNENDSVNSKHVQMLYTDLAALAFKLNKPLSCRLLPLPRQNGEMTTGLLDSPYLTDTKIFQI